MGVQDAVRFAGNARANHVRDGDDPRATATRLANPSQGIGGLARLCDRHNQRVLIDDGVAVAELARDHDLDRRSGPALDERLRHQTGVVRRAARNYEDAVQRGDVLDRHV